MARVLGAMVCVVWRLLGVALSQETLHQVGSLASGSPTIITDVGNDTEKEESAGGFSVKITGKSGKFTYYQKTATEETKVEVEFDELSELDADEKDVGKDGPDKHSIKNFASQSFRFSDVTEVTIGTATANLISFSSNISTVGKLRVDTYIVSKAGLAGPPGDEWSLSPGNLKFNIVFDSWSFCDPCFTKDNKEEYGQFLQLDVKIKGKSGSPGRIGGKGGKGGKGGYDLGGDREVLLTSQYSADGQELVMPEGYPYVKSKKNQQVFEFRFARFNNTLLYDPVLGKLSPAPPPDSGAFGLSGIPAVLAAMLVAALVSTV